MAINLKINLSLSTSCQSSFQGNVMNFKIVLLTGIEDTILNSAFQGLWPAMNDIVCRKTPYSITSKSESVA